MNYASKVFRGFQFAFDERLIAHFGSDICEFGSVATPGRACAQARSFVASLIFPTVYAMSGGLILQWVLGYNFSVAVWVGYIALFGIAVETGVVMVVYLHEALQHQLATGTTLTDEDVEQATIEGAVQRLRPKLMTVTAVILSLAPILWESGIGSDVMKPIAAPIVGGMITSTVHVLILVPVFFFLMKRRGLRRGDIGTTRRTDQA